MTLDKLVALASAENNQHPRMQTDDMLFSSTDTEEDVARQIKQMHARHPGCVIVVSPSRVDGYIGGVSALIPDAAPQGADQSAT